MESVGGEKRINREENPSELNDIGRAAEILMALSRANPNTSNNDGKRVRGRKGGLFIGVTYTRGRWLAYIWLKNHKHQLDLGRHFIAEGAARSSDKAMLVIRDGDGRLNYPETDYDMNLIKEWRKVFNVDVKKFGDELIEQSSGYSEGCTKGLNNEAGHELLELINEHKMLEMRRH